MKRSVTFKFFWPILFLAFGCGPAIKGDVSEPGKGDPKIAGETAPGGYNAPAHKFEARRHPSHRRTLTVPKPNYSSLPALKLSMGNCYGMYDKEEKKIAAGAKPRPPVMKKPKPKKKNGGKKYKGKKSSKKYKRPTSKSGGAGYGTAGGGALAGATKSSPAPVATPSPAGPPPAVAQPSPPRSAAPADDFASAPSAQSSRPDRAKEAEPAMEMAESEEYAGADLDDRDSELQIAGDEGEPIEDEIGSEYEDWGAEIYLSNDDTMSLSSAQRVIYAIDNFLPLPLDHIRPHELLNYFSFETLSVGDDDDFSVLADVAEDPREDGIYSLSLAVRGRPVDRASRRNMVLTWVIDRSGSMHDEGRMDYLKRGLRRSVNELKDGDMVHMVLFDHEVCVPVENFVVGRDKISDLERAVDALRPMGATDIHKGLSRGYEIADRTYQAEYSNRVILITDALTNTGVTDERMISMISKYYDGRRIRLSGVGVGRDFNDSLLDRLTERGKGAYVFLGSQAEVDAVFGPRFISMIETTALDVHFQLHLPESLRMNVFYGEESSTVKEDVQAIHYFANTSQLFLSDLMARGGEIRPQDDVMLTIEYKDPETGDELFEEYALNLGEIHGEAFNVRKARLIMAWVDLLAQMAARPIPSMYSYSIGAWEDADGWNACEDGRVELGHLFEGLEKDGEATRVVDLWDKYCSRYERPRNPVKRQIVKTDDSWPSAKKVAAPR